MRGCLFIVALALGLGGLFVVVGLPRLVEGLVTAGLGAAGVEATALDVSVDAGPAELLGGRAARVTIEATGVRYRDLRADRARIVLGDVDLVTRTPATIEGVVEAVILAPSADETVPIERIVLGGTGARMTVRAELAEAAIAAHVTHRLRESTGIEVDGVRLEAPDRLVVELAGVAAEGRLVIDAAGSLVLRLESPVASADVLLVDSADLPVRLTGVAVVGSRLVLEGVVRPEP